MTFEDAVFRARLAYGQGLSKQAAEKDPDPKKQQKIDSYTNAVRRGSAYANMTTAKETADAADQKALDAQQQADSDRANLVDSARTIYGDSTDVAGITQQEREESDARRQWQKDKEKYDQRILDAEAAARANRNWSIGAGIGGGLAVGAGAYGLAGLFPSLRKRRLLRALIALGAGGAGGVGIGYGVSKGLESGKLQAALGSAKDKAVGAYNTVANKANNVVSAIKG